MDKSTLVDVLLPNMLRSCAKDILKNEISYDGHIVIIGAGVAGLYAACLLQEKGINFTILEASDKAGGRVAVEKKFTNYPIDTGAEWLHGSTSIIASLVELSNTEIFLDKAKPRYWHQKKLRKRLPKRLQKIFDQLEYPNDDISFEEYFLQSGGEKDELNLLTPYASDVGASANMISAKWEAEGYNQISYGDDDYKFRKTYFDFVAKYITSQVADKIHFKTIVSQVNQHEGRISVETKNGKQYKADKVIVTVPLSILKDEDISFSPSLPKAKKIALSQLGMEAGIKLFLKFSKTFAEADIIGGEICGYYVIETYKTFPGEFMIVAFTNGNQAKHLSELGETKAVKLILEELDEMLDNQASKYYLDHFMKDWSKEPFIRGAYSYPLVGSNESTRKVLAEPIDNKIFFAGEATNYNGHHQTVHGAIETAYREVISILEGM